MTKKEERQHVYEMFDGRCAYCGDKLGKNWHVDHVEPIWRYRKRGEDGSIVTVVDRPENDRLDNKMPACYKCNIWKHTFTLEQFRDELKQQVRRARDYSRNFRMAEKFGLVRETNQDVVFHFEKHLPDCYTQKEE